MPKTAAPFHRLLVVLALTALTASPGRALQLPGPDLPALLQVNSVRETSFGQDVQIDRVQTLISRGGGLFLLDASKGPTGSRFLIGAFRGLGTPEQLATLGRALTEARVGTQKDCIHGNSAPGHVEITWFGRAGRRNTFRIVLQEEEPLSSDQCPAEAVLLIYAVERYAGDAISNLPQD